MYPLSLVMVDKKMKGKYEKMHVLFTHFNFILYHIYIYIYIYIYRFFFGDECPLNISSIHILETSSNLEKFVKDAMAALEPLS